MGGEKEKTEAPASSSETTPPLAPITPETVEEKEVVAPAPSEEKPEESKALAVVEEVEEPVKSIGGSLDRDASLARVETEKRIALVTAWEDNEKTRAENKAIKQLATISSWENAQKAAVEAELKKEEELLEKKKAEYAEKLKNKVALIHKKAEEKKAIVEAKRGEEILKVEELAAKYRITGLASKKILGCFGV